MKDLMRNAMRSFEDAFGPRRTQQRIHAHTDPITFENRRELLDQIASRMGEGYIYAAREALKRRDLIACDAALKALGFPP
jgi:hypothetical protein